MKPSLRISTRTVFLPLCLLVFTGASAEPCSKQARRPVLFKPGIVDVNTLDVNRIKCFFMNDGHMGENPATGGDGLYYDTGQGSHSVIYSGGFWVLGKINGDIRSSACYYATEFQPGAILADGLAGDSASAEYRIYKYNRGEAVDASAIAQGCPSEVLGDQMLFCVFNDMRDHDAIWRKPPIGLEVQMTAWAYDRPGALENTIFIRYRLVNKGAEDLRDAYTALWSDADVGDARDDFTGCDTSLGVAYAYNGDGMDLKFGAQVPAVGYQLLQGPLAASAGDTAAFPGGEAVPGMKFQGMSAYFPETCGSPIAGMCGPSLQDSRGAEEAYWLVSSLTAVGDHWLDASRSYEPTRFPLAGDPVAGTGWLMAQVNSPKDVKMGLSTGPFDLAAGESQDVVFGVVVGLGVNNINSISVMRYYDAIITKAYWNDFCGTDLEPLPLRASRMDKDIMLIWDPAPVEEFESANYAFEGYNVWQAEYDGGLLQKIASFDSKNGITGIRDWGFNGSTNSLDETTVQTGSDNGLQTYFRIDRDYLRGGDLVNGREYYFSVTAYGYNPAQTPRVLETPHSVSTAVPGAPVLGVEYRAAIGDTLPAVREGVSDGHVVVEVMNPAELTGHSYEVRFDSVSSGSGKNLVWSVFDRTLNSEKLSGLPVKEFETGDEDFPIVDGMKFKVSDPPDAFKNIQVVANASGPLDPPEMGCFAFQASGFPALLGYDGNPVLNAEGQPIDSPDPARQQVRGGAWGIHIGMIEADMRATFWYFIDRVTNSGARWPVIIPNDFEMRFTAAGGKGFIANAYSSGADGGVLIDVPFELWNVGTSMGPEDDVRYIPYIRDDDNNQQFNLLTQASVTAAGDWSYGVADHTASDGTDDPFTDWFYWGIPEDITPGQAGYEALIAKIQAEGDNYVYLNGTQGDCMRRMVLVNWNGGDVNTGIYNSDMPETGTVFRILTNKPLRPSVRYIIDTAEYAKSKSAAAAAARIHMINVFPNPYFGDNPAEPSPSSQFVTFSNLPEKCTIRIFSLSGVLVRTIVHDNGTPFERWDLLNSGSLPVGSGIYLAHIRTEYGERVLKLAVINRKQSR
jgi:hypothetical protein